MGRPKIIKTNRHKKKETKKISLQLDAECIAIINNLKAANINYSAWMRKMLKFHYGQGLSPEQKHQLLREEMALAAQTQRESIKKAEDEYFAQIRLLEQKMSSLNCSVAIISRDEK